MTGAEKVRDAAVKYRTARRHARAWLALGNEKLAAHLRLIARHHMRMARVIKKHHGI